MTALLPATGLQLNPDAAHPPFGWTVDLPADWTVLDTNPASWTRGADRLIDERLAGQRLKSADRRAVRHALDELVAAAQRGNVLLSLIQIGQLSGGGIATAGLNIAWYDSTPDLAGLALVRQAIGAQGVVSEHETELGTIVLQSDHLSLVPPGSDSRVGMTSMQAFLPIPDQPWTLVVASVAAQPAMHDVLHMLVLAVASSVRPISDAADGTNASGPDVPFDAAAGFHATTLPHGPGVERGFGTMVRHQIDPDGQAD